MKVFGWMLTEVWEAEASVMKDANLLVHPFSKLCN